MAAGMSVDLERAIRIMVFSGSVMPADLEFIGGLYGDAEHYRLTDREIAFFTPDVSLAQIDTEDLGGLADRYSEVRRDQDNALREETVWVMPDQVRSEARLWREFTRESHKADKQRVHVDTLAGAIAAYRMPAGLIEDIRHGRGFRQFGVVEALATAV